MNAIVLLLLTIPDIPTTSPTEQGTAYAARASAQAAYGETQGALMACVVTADAIRVLTDQTNDAQTLGAAIDILNAAQAAMDFYLPAYATHMEAGGAKLAAVAYVEDYEDKNRLFSEAADQFGIARQSMVEAEDLIDVRLAQLRFMLEALRNPTPGM
jgi:hypothetical protein